MVPPFPPLVSLPSPRAHTHTPTHTPTHTHTHTHTHTQARQATIQRAQVARGFSYLLGKADKLTSVGAPAALLGCAFLALVGGASQMYTKPGSN